MTHTPTPRREPRTNLIAQIIVMHLWRHPKHDPTCEVCGYIKVGKWPS